MQINYKLGNIKIKPATIRGISPCGQVRWTHKYTDKRHAEEIFNNLATRYKKDGTTECLELVSGGKLIKEYNSCQ